MLHSDRRSTVGWAGATAVDFWLVGDREGQVSGPQVLYLSRGDLDALQLPISDVIDAVEAAFREHGAGRSVMPPKTRLSHDRGHYYSAMPAILLGAGVAAVKWNSMCEDNPARGLPFVVGLLILNDDRTGLPIAIMDASWVTAKRTAAATAVTASHLAARPPKTLGLYGCGVQGYSHAEALKAAFPGMERIQAYDVDRRALSAYASNVGRDQQIEVIACSDPREVIRGADLVVTATPTTVRNEVLEADWLEPGQLLVSLDYDCYWTPEALQRLDLVFTDDRAQLEKSRGYGYYRTLGEVAGEIPQVVAGRCPGRGSDEQVIAAFNAGIAIEDVATAHRLYQRACASGAGTLLPL
jgi:ornithine cyclodeaminase/alanine dehydrogenase